MKEAFPSRTPLPLTDAVVGPDGALYFTVGGRGTQSQLFRVTMWASSRPRLPTATRSAMSRNESLRHQIEAYHVVVPTWSAAPFLVRHWRIRTGSSVNAAAWRGADCSGRLAGSGSGVYDPGNGDDRRGRSGSVWRVDVRTAAAGRAPE